MRRLVLLFTRDFFSIARKRLRPAGVFCQWTQLYELWLLRGFLEVFAAVQIYRSGVDAILLGAEAERGRSE